MRPTPQEESLARERHTSELPVQMQHERAAMQNRQNFAAINHGRPAIAATGRPGDFSSRSIVGARAAGGEYHPPTISPREARVNSGSFNRGNSGNRGNAMPANRGNANEGFRPFTPPARGGNPNPSVNSKRDNNGFNRGGSNPNVNPNRGTSMPANRGNGNEGFRQFNPPSQGGNANPNVNTNRGNQNRYNENRGNANRDNQRRPPNQPQMARPNQGAPRESRPAPPPQRHQGPPPKEERHR